MVPVNHNQQRKKLNNDQALFLKKFSPLLPFIALKSCTPPLNDEMKKAGYKALKTICVAKEIRPKCHRI